MIQEPDERASDEIPTYCLSCGASVPMRAGRPRRFSVGRDHELVRNVAEAYLRLGTLAEVARIAKQRRWKGRWTTGIISMLLRGPVAAFVLDRDVYAAVQARLSRGPGRKRKAAE